MVRCSYCRNDDSQQCWLAGDGEACRAARDLPSWAQQLLEKIIRAADRSVEVDEARVPGSRCASRSGRAEINDDSDERGSMLVLGMRDEKMV